MQRERSALDSFPEPIDLNQGSLPNNNSSMDHLDSCDNMLNGSSSTNGNIVSSTNASNDNISHHSFNGWDRGESSSTPPNNIQDQDWSFQPSNNISSTSYLGNNQMRGSSSTPVIMHNYSSNPNLSSIQGHAREHARHHSPYKPEMEHIPTLYPSSSNVGTFSGAFSENIGPSSPPFGTWGPPCKRKTLEGTANSSSGQLYPCGSSSSNNQHYSTQGNLTISSGPLNLSPPTNNYSEQINNPSSGVHMRRTVPAFFPTPSVTESSAGRNFSVRSSQGRRESFPLDTHRGNSSRSFGGHAPELRSSMALPTNQSNNSSSQPHSSMHVYPWNGSLTSRGGGSSSSGAREEFFNFRNSHRNLNNSENAPQEQVDWSFAPRASRNSHSSVGRASSSSSSGNAAWLPHHQSLASRDHPRLSETWIPFHRDESESGLRRSHFQLLASGPSSSSSLSNEAGGSSSRGQRQLDQRAFMMDVPGDDIDLRALAAVESRHRLIRQVLNAMRRGVHMQSEDYMLVDPFMNGFVELHDRHRDMRLDVDNMSYEELLALEERIGSVSTGLSEDQIRASMKRRKHEGMRMFPNLEPCCICQEDYVARDDIGILDCGHEFHTGCVKQWLTLKNICPICKMTALKT